MPAVGGPDVTVTSSRYGGHHSPVANILGGKGLFIFAGSQTHHRRPLHPRQQDRGVPGLPHGSRDTATRVAATR